MFLHDEGRDVRPLNADLSFCGALPFYNRLIAQRFRVCGQTSDGGR